MTNSLPIIGLTPLGDPSAASCDGDFCAVPEHHTQAIVNRRLDDDNV
ncbi:MAG: hypothetical protein ACOH10_01180 [Rhodoglobus sp.]|nr:hypothetical protein [Salinibacterium sp. G-O1]MDJ0335397.1 hypothetical protein [Salinibacterium sp. G-O1]